MEKKKRRKKLPTFSTDQTILYLSQRKPNLVLLATETGPMQARSRRVHLSSQLLASGLQRQPLSLPRCGVGPGHASCPATHGNDLSSSGQFLDVATISRPHARSARVADGASRVAPPRGSLPAHATGVAATPVPLQDEERDLSGCPARRGSPCSWGRHTGHPPRPCQLQGLPHSKAASGCGRRAWPHHQRPR